MRTFNGPDTTTHYQEQEDNMEQTESMNISMMKTKGKVMAYWATTALLAFAVGSGGVGELTHQWGTLETVQLLGYPLYFLTILGTWKVLGTIALLVPRFPRLKEWAYAGIFFGMTGAAASHAFANNYGDYAYHIFVPLSLAVLVIASWALRPQSRTLGNLTGSIGSILKRV